ncbi:chemotaxis protein CheW [Phormidium yuhuli AB48]|uniref:Chemotaxis protein CheW n=1 Tax=Phormidium yuhuli AB48 TaxID=2940671 RepID=A0ABY5AXM2_9CYAN|nr:chemotaxis protein CheW [Phormidium yuhuli]USR93056.1 chemotaxis protein CheW [Phormidium yuhuli AB48]
MERDYFKVRVSGEVRVALPLDAVDAALQLDRQLICPIPGVMPSLLGVINRQGVLTWVLDTRQFLDLPSGHSSPGLNLPGQAVKALLLTRELAPKASLTLPGDEDESLMGHDGPPGRGANRQRQTIACVVADLERVFTASRSRQVRQRLKPRLQPLLSQVVYDGHEGVAVLDPQALLDALQEQPLSRPRSTTAPVGAQNVSSLHRS